MNNFDFNSLNESHGVKVFNNIIFESSIKSIPGQLLHPSNMITHFIIDGEPVEFYKLKIV